MGATTNDALRWPDEATAILAQANRHMRTLAEDIDAKRYLKTTTGGGNPPAISAGSPGNGRTLYRRNSDGAVFLDRVTKQSQLAFMPRRIVDKGNNGGNQQGTELTHEQNGFTIDNERELELELDLSLTTFEDTKFDVGVLLLLNGVTRVRTIVTVQPNMWVPVHLKDDEITASLPAPGASVFGFKTVSLTAGRQHVIANNAQYVYKTVLREF